MAHRLIDVDERFWAKVNKTETCWLWTGATAAGYGILAQVGSDTPLKAHRYSYERANGPIPSGLFVCHTCDVRACVNPDHLFLGTSEDNIRDMIAKGRNATGERSGMRKNPAAHVRGERHPQAKMTVESVRELRTLATNGVPYADLSRRFSLSYAAISAIIHHRTWAHVS